jgi:hypothetical protein
MAVLIIDNDYKLVSDQYNWTLQKRRVIQKGDRTGEEDWDNISYHASIKQALSSYLERSLRMSDAESLKALQDISNSCEEKIEKLFENVTL